MGPRFQFCYMAYPIDQSTPGMAENLRQFGQVVQTLQARGIIGVTFDPGDAFNVATGTPVTPHIAKINEYAAAMADLVVAYLPKGVPTIGVPIEIDRAARAGKPVVVFTDFAGSWMMQYPGNVHFVSFEAGNRADLAAEWLVDQPVVDEQPEAMEPLPVVAARDEWAPIYDESADGARLPTRGHDDDAGLDLYVSETVRIDPGQAVDVPCGLAVQLPEWSWGFLVGRSSARRVHGLLIHPGIIDAGYRGELFALAENTTNEPVWVEPGQRLAQLIVMPNLTRDLSPIRVEELEPSKRGTNGFGSTGR